MNNEKLSLGIDTSNYKTSVALVDCSGNVLFNHQQLLEVKKGERGLRQSTALFQHIQNLPPVFEKLFSDKSIAERIGSVSVSETPRPVEGSYMPVFTAGMGYGRSIAAALNIPLYKFSHQEGHIEAVKHYSSLRDKSELICFHFSGGTTEAVLVDHNKYTLVGGSLDLSYGQVLDRIGVALGMDFPAGAEMDKIAVSHMESNIKEKIFTPLKVRDGYVNLSGIETQGQRSVGHYSKEAIISDLFANISKSVLNMTHQLAEEYHISDFIYAGGVSGSLYMKNYLKHNLNKEITAVFGKPELASDNAIGIALLGGKNLWL